MKRVSVVLASNCPLLMNRRPMEDAAPDKVKKKGDTFDPVEDAEKKAHFDDKIGYYIPSDVIEGALREAGKNIKQGRGSYKKTVLSSVFVEQEKVPLGRKDYDEIDKRFGTLPSNRMGILISRVRFNKWQLSFTLAFDETRVDERVIKALLEEAGAVIGIGSYRPKFGRFKVEKFELLKDKKIA